MLFPIIQYPQKILQFKILHNEYRVVFGVVRHLDHAKG